MNETYDRGRADMALREAMAQKMAQDVAYSGGLAPGRDVPELGRIHNRLDDINNHISGIAGVLDDLANRALGPLPPEPAQSDTGARLTKAQNVGVVGSIDDMLSRCHQSLERLSNIASRLTRLA
jgi:hypothetical protein